MARILPPAPPAPALENPVDVNRLRNYEGYRARLADINWSRTRPEYGDEKRLVLDWELVDLGGSVRDYLNLKLGRQQSGQVSKLRQLLNALAERSETAEIAWFNDDEGDEAGENPLCWGYEGSGVPERRLHAGIEVSVRGKLVERSDGQGRRYQVEVYESASAAPAPAATDGHSGREPQLSPPRRQEVPDDVPF